MDPRAVFLSYASQDAEAVARVRDELERAGVEVWIDQAELKGGDAWDAAIRRRIKECALFVPIVSAATEARGEGYFRLEWKLAVDRSHLMAEDRAFLLPVSLDGTPQQSARVPDRFREVQWSRVTGLEEIAAFADRVARLLDRSTGATPSSPLRAAPTSPASGARQPSIAVLPFVNMSRDEENEYFADGLSEELLNVLAHIRGLRVASRTSAFHFKGKTAPIATIAGQLGVATILEGSVRKAGKRVRVTAQLIEAATDSHLWSQTYDRDLEDIFAVQDDIARAVVTELRGALMGEGRDGDELASELRSAAAGRTEDAEAHRLYLQGRFFAQRATRDDTFKAVELFEQAVARDPGYAAGWAGLSISTWTLAGHSWVPAAAGFERSRAAAKRAVELGPGLPEAHVAMYRIHAVDWNWQAATESLERARAIAPGDAQVLRALGRHLACIGRIEESEEHLRRAVELDPLSYGGHFNLGAHCFFGGRLDEAEQSIRRGLELNPMGGMAHGMLAFIHLFRGEPDRALEESALEKHLVPKLSSEAMAHHALGRTDLSDAAIARIATELGDDASFNVAQVYGWRRDAERTFEWLERAFAARDVGIGNLLFDPFLAPYRADPRFRALVQRVGLPA